MIANAAFAAALITFLMTAWMAGELTFLAPFRRALFHEHGATVLGGILVVFLNLCALFYGAARVLFLRDAGRKLTHLDRELRRGGAPHEELAAYFQNRER